MTESHEIMASRKRNSSFVDRITTPLITSFFISFFSRNNEVNGVAKSPAKNDAVQWPKLNLEVVSGLLPSHHNLQFTTYRLDEGWNLTPSLCGSMTLQYFFAVASSTTIQFNTSSSYTLWHDLLKRNRPFEPPVAGRGFSILALFIFPIFKTKWFYCDEK